jgi:predicted site-specific integrase-resolvase
MARVEEYIGSEELSRRSGTSKQTILRFARAGLITCRRKGLGKIRGQYEFPASIAEEQLKRLRERQGIHVPATISTSAPAPAISELITEVRNLGKRFERLEAEVRNTLSAAHAQG